MTQAIAYKTSVRNFVKTPPINSAGVDPVTTNGVRISMPIYIDVPNSQRKELLNAVREVISGGYSTRSTQTQSGLQVESASSSESDVESYLGLSLDNLRSVLFSRGGLPLDLLLKIQSVAGIEVMSEKELLAAFKSRQKYVQEWMKNNPFN
ncbi:hypothetical protein OAE23_01475 [Synechococcus sp. AH-551-E11]|nr:hypothetical protein [Synechococcus sp. AH-551-E11]MDB4616753.1 hypothetical protein [Synechococcus sp. AH-551-E11]